ncbi:MAG: zinc-dependent alcohol dehydrogenase [Eubacteriales bacterium]|jgi:threonine dehydrogenase-like Zn-dependent dehydrogenase
MKNVCAVLTDNRQFTMREEEFQVAPTHPVLRVTHVGVCGTDLSYWKDGAAYQGMVIGHEYAGVIEEPGTSELYQRGDRVVGFTQNQFGEPCGHCKACLAGRPENCTGRVVGHWKGGDLNQPGAYSRYTTWFPRSFFKLPEGISLEQAAVIEPFAVALNAVKRSDVQPGEKVLILGGGLIGLAVSEWVRLFGVAEVTITELNGDKCRMIQGFGIADHVMQADDPDIARKLQEASQGGYDMVFDCVGAESAINLGIDSLKKEFGKKFIAVALPHDFVRINYRELVLRKTVFLGSKGHTFGGFGAVMRSIADGHLQVDKYISRRIPFSRLQEGFESIEAARGADVKVVVEMEK